MAPPVKSVVDFLMYLFKDRKLQPSTIDGYRSAIADKLANSPVIGPKEIEIFKVSLELASSIQIHSLIYIEFPVKISARLTNFKGCFGLIWHFMNLSPTTLP